MRVNWISLIPLLTKLIGPEYLDYKTKRKCKVIIRFTTFRHNTLVYYTRKKIRNNVKIRLDLTKETYALLLEANNLVKGNNDVKFCFADINCCMKIKRGMNYGQVVFSIYLGDVKKKCK